MKINVTRLIILLTLTFVEPAFPQTIHSIQTQSTPPVIDELILKSGLWNQMAQIEPLVQMGAGQAQDRAGDKRMSDSDFQQLKAAFSSVYSADNLRVDLRRHLADHLSLQDQKSALEWLNSELGQKFTQLEEQIGDSKDETKKQAAIAKLIGSLPSSRIKLLEHFAQVLNLGESYASMMITTRLALAKGLILKAPAGTPEQIESMTRQLESQRPQVIATMRNRAVGQFAYAYESMTDIQIGKYIEFADSPSGRRYHAALIIASEKVMNEATLKMGREINTKKPA